MSGLWEVARETLRFLSSREELADLTFCEDFPAAAKESPLRRITVAVGLEAGGLRAGCTWAFLGGFGRRHSNRRSMEAAHPPANPCAEPPRGNSMPKSLFAHLGSALF